MKQNASFKTVTVNERSYELLYRIVSKVNFNFVTLQYIQINFYFVAIRIKTYENFLHNLDNLKIHTLKSQLALKYRFEDTYCCLGFMFSFASSSQKNIC